ncbi:McrC family protein [Pontibacter toksunensis]|uniref:McrC family protein n=1 Tax=Pontibacter toksunensis TaxID=1332631 RepID=A0ABW6C1J9_9BACT
MLFEYSTFHPLGKLNRKKLESFLQQVWQERYIAYAEEFLEADTTPEEEKRYQPFLKFDGDTFRTQNFIGFIQQDGEALEIYPKVFKREQDTTKALILDHIFYWFSYCIKFHFPIMEASLDKREADSLPELLIWHFANYTAEVIASQPYSQYQEVAEALYSPKGRIDFSAYIRNGVTTGNYHHIDCVHEPFLYDNTLNRVIKYVCRLLQSSATLSSTQALLQQITFQLDEVEDIPCSASDLDTVTLNPLFTEYAPIVEWCRRILNQQLYSSNTYDSLQWALLLPMEYVFEDFVAGFIRKHFGNVYKVHSQKSNLHLSQNPKAFQMQHDIFLEHRKTGEKIIIDTKYKPRWDLHQSDVKQGVAQPDMYQMVSYAYRRECSKVLLLYPNTSEELASDYTFSIPSGLGENSINITVCEVPFWNAITHKKVEEDLKNALANILEC